MQSHRKPLRQARRALLEGLESRFLFAFGKTDVTFGDQGRAQPSIPNPIQTQRAKDIMLADGGKLIVSGDAGIIRLNADGSTDNPFGSNKGTVRLGGFSFEGQTQDA